jgi:hypothetical protein
MPASNCGGVQTEKKMKILVIGLMSLIVVTGGATRVSAQRAQVCRSYDKCLEFLKSRGGERNKASKMCSRRCSH